MKLKTVEIMHIDIPIDKVILIFYGQIKFKAQLLESVKLYVN